MFDRTLSLTLAALVCSSAMADQCPLSRRNHQPQTAQHSVARHHQTHVVAVEKSQSNIVETAQAAGSFRTLLAAAKAAELSEALQTTNPITVFAPTDEAFKKLPEGTVETLLKPENKKQLSAILLYHVVPGNLTADKVTKLSAAQSKQGEMVPFRVKGDTVAVGGAKVVKANIACSNGVIHVIDSVIMPPSMQKAQQHSGAHSIRSESSKSKDIVDTAVSAGSFKTLVAAVKAAGLAETLKGDGPFTVFAPTDEAFKELPEGTLDSLLKPESKDKLVSILTDHVVPGKVMAQDVTGLKSAKTVNGKEVPIKVSDGKVRIGNANVVKTDILCDNGVIHIIDAVILP